MTKTRNCSTPRRDEFAELLSEGLTRSEIMDRMKITEAGYRKHIRAIKTDLGWQAA